MWVAWHCNGGHVCTTLCGPHKVLTPRHRVSHHILGYGLKKSFFGLKLEISGEKCLFFGRKKVFRKKKSFQEKKFSSGKTGFWVTG